MATIKKIKKAQAGIKQEWYNPRDKDSTTRRTVVADTSGYSAGAKSFPTKTTTSRGTSSGTASKKQVDKMIKNPKMGAYGVTPKGKKGMKIKKAQNGYDDKLRYPKDAKKSYEESGNPKINLVKPKTGPRLVDTTGYSAGRNIFPTKSTKPVPGTGYGKAKRKDVEKSIQASKNKNGGMTKKCKYGCK
jgi:hypothetical protein